jgi:hypothetical protein
MILKDSLVLTWPAWRRSSSSCSWGASRLLYGVQALDMGLRAAILRLAVAARARYRRRAASVDP